MLEPCAVRVASTVLRGPGGSNVSRLPDRTALTVEEAMITAGSRTAQGSRKLPWFRAFLGAQVGAVITIDFVPRSNLACRSWSGRG